MSVLIRYWREDYHRHSRIPQCKSTKRTRAHV